LLKFSAPAATIQKPYWRRLEFFPYLNIMNQENLNPGILNPKQHFEILDGLRELQL